VLEVARGGHDHRDPRQQLVWDDVPILEVEAFELPEKLVDLGDELVHPEAAGLPARLDRHGPADVDVGLLEHPKLPSLRLEYPRLGPSLLGVSKQKH